MKELFDVEISVISQKGHCAAHHKVGDRWIVHNWRTPEGLCISALNAMIPALRAMWLGCNQPWDNVPGETEIACPDPKNPVIFKVKRVVK